MSEGDIAVIWTRIRKDQKPGYNVTLFDTEQEANDYVVTLKSLKEPYEAIVCRVINWNGKRSLNEILRGTEG